MKDDYTRSTRSVAASELPAPFRDALAAAARGAHIVDLDATVGSVILTHSVKSRAAGFFARVLGDDADREHWTVLAIAPDTALVGTYGEARGSWVRALPLATLELQAMPSIAGELGARTIMLASPVLASLGPDGQPTRVGAYPLVLGTTGDAEDAKRALEGAIASRHS